MAESKVITSASGVIGVDNYTFFEVTKDDKEGTTYGDAYQFPGTIEIAPTDEGGVEPIDADNGVFETMSYIGNIGHELTRVDIPPEVDAMWRGLKVDENGGVLVGTETSAPYFGVAWRTERVNGTHRYFRCYKGQYGFVSKVGARTKPGNGAPEHSEATATYTAAKRISDGALYYFIDDTNFDEAKKAEIAEKWFTDMTYTPSAE